MLNPFEIGQLPRTLKRPNAQYTMWTRSNHAREETRGILL